jgi:hypothetical protein
MIFIFFQERFVQCKVSEPLVKVLCLVDGDEAKDRAKDSKPV